MFVTKLEPQGPSTMGGRRVEGRTQSTMILDDHAPPFIASDGAVKTTEVGVMEVRRLGPGAAQALAAGAATRLGALPPPRRSPRSLRRSDTAMDPRLEARLERLGIVARESNLQRWFTVVDMPLA